MMMKRIEGIRNSTVKLFIAIEKLELCENLQTFVNVRTKFLEWFDEVWSQSVGILILNVVVNVFQTVTVKMLLVNSYLEHNLKL